MMDKTKNRIKGVVFALVLPVTTIVALISMLGLAVIMKAKYGTGIKETMSEAVQGMKTGFKAIKVAIVKGELVNC